MNITESSPPVGSGTIYTSDKTWKEIHDAFVAGIPVLKRVTYEGYADEKALVDINVEAYDNTSIYTVIFYCGNHDNDVSATLECNSENGYPSYTST